MINPSDRRTADSIIRAIAYLCCRA